MAKRRNPTSSRSWDPVADWYTGWSGAKGSEHHRRIAIPAALELLAPLTASHVLDIGCGPAAIAPWITRAGGRYTGVDASRRLVAYARRHNGAHGRLIHADAARLNEVRELEARGFDSALFLLSIQDIDPLDVVLKQASALLRDGGHVVIVMTHPCFRVPRQSGWGWDEGRRLRYRRVDHYLTPLSVPMKTFGPDARGATRSRHRPLEQYVDALRDAGLVLDTLRELPTHRSAAGAQAAAQRRADREIPLFMALRAVKPPATQPSRCHAAASGSGRSASTPAAGS